MKDRTAENAPDGPILVWVRDGGRGQDGKPIAVWRMGYVTHYVGLPPRLRAEGYNGNWDIPYWAPLPDHPE